MDEKPPIIPPDPEVGADAAGESGEPPDDLLDPGLLDEAQAPAAGPEGPEAGLPGEVPPVPGAAHEETGGGAEPAGRRKRGRTPPPELSVEEQRRRLEEETGEREGTRRRHSRRPASDYRHFG